MDLTAQVVAAINAFLANASAQLLAPALSALGTLLFTTPAFDQISEVEQLALQVEAIAFLDVRSRLARYLMDDRGLGAARFRQEDIAAAVGANIYTVNKTLRDFARRNLVTVERRRVHILDEAQLRLEIRP